VTGCTCTAGLSVRPTRPAEFIEIRGRDGAPPYLVRHDDGHEALVFPGTDASVEHPQSRERT